MTTLRLLFGVSELSNLVTSALVINFPTSFREPDFGRFAFLWLYLIPSLFRVRSAVVMLVQLILDSDLLQLLLLRLQHRMCRLDRDILRLDMIFYVLIQFSGEASSLHMEVDLEFLMKFELVNMADCHVHNVADLSFRGLAVDLELFVLGLLVPRKVISFLVLRWLRAVYVEGLLVIVDEIFEDTSDLIDALVYDALLAVFFVQGLHLARERVTGVGAPLQLAVRLHPRF
jgi:hypothetical protein